MKLSLRHAVRPNAIKTRGDHPQALITHLPLSTVLAIAALRSDRAADVEEYTPSQRPTLRAA